MIDFTSPQYGKKCLVELFKNLNIKTEVELRDYSKINQDGWNIKYNEVTILSWYDPYDLSIKMSYILNKGEVSSLIFDVESPGFSFSSNWPIGKVNDSVYDYFSEIMLNYFNNRKKLEGNIRFFNSGSWIEKDIKISKILC